MNYFTHEIINERLVRIKDLTTTACYLALGDKKTCLVDTCGGCGSLRDYVRDNFHKEVDLVILSHSHLDHAGGIYEFQDLPIYMNHEDIVLGNRDNTRKRRSDMFAREGSVDDPDLIMPNIDFNITIPLNDKDVLDLGGLSLEAIHTPGHTHGMTMILFRELRTILFGDGCGVGVLIYNDDSTSIEEYLESLLKVKEREDDYDYIIRNHGTCCSEKDLLDNVIECCRDILDGNDDHADVYDALPEGMEDVYYARAIDPISHNRLDGKFGNIAYSPKKIHKQDS